MAAVTARFLASTDGVLEEIAAEFGLTPREVAACLPASTGVCVPGELFEEIMRDVSEWGVALFLVHTPDLILECAGSVPYGTMAQGYFNLIGDSPIGGHLRRWRCAAIQFISRPVMGHDSHAIVFFNIEGGVMFKIFVGRDARHALKPDQVARFLALRDRLAIHAEAGHERAG
ncbi:heme utilization cystosolic carrier protein HutX [Roseospira visakhapatnamensis]|nr:heme utilization cystosolic carrier protein HutX [Roseospira visakhapatnamensis]